MNILQLVLKQMRQRSLSTWLTLLSVLLGVGLAISIMVLHREGQQLFGQRDYGYDVLIGAKGSPLQLVLNTVYHMDRSPGNIPYSLYADLAEAENPAVQWAVPFAVGDNYKGHRIIGTQTKLFGLEESGDPIDPATGQRPQYGRDRYYEIAEGRVFHPRKFEAVIGAEVARQTGLTIGSTFNAEHGLDGTTERDKHDEQWTVVGILKPTRTANDRLLFIPLISFYAIPSHEKGMEDIAELNQPTAQAPGHDPHADHAHAAESPATAPAHPGHDHDVHEDEHAHHGHDADHAHPAARNEHARYEGHAMQGDGAVVHGDGTADWTVPPQGHAAHTTAPADHHQAGHGESDGHDDHDGHHHHEHAYHLEPDGTIELHLDRSKWQLSAILLRTRTPALGMQLMWQINNAPAAMAVNPAEQMRGFFAAFLDPIALALLAISWLVAIVAGVSILVSIYNAVAARTREIAILRALGATRVRILALVCLEAGLIGAVGAVAGWAVGHGLCAVASAYLYRMAGETIGWLGVSGWEILYLGAVVVMAVLAGLVPALKAYRTPVATNLVAA